MIMRIIIATIALLLASPMFAQTSLKAGPEVNGISLGATREEVIRKLGKPASQTKKTADECVGGVEMTLRYPGLTFRLWDDPRNAKKFSVGAFEVASAKWNVSGVKIGSSSADVRKIFGKRSSEEIDSQSKLPVWYYEMDEEEGPGTTNFTFKGGKLIKIYTMWLMC